MIRIFNTTSVRQILVLSISYTLIGKASLLFTSSDVYITSLTPVAGIAVSAVLLWGYRVSIGVFLGAFALSLWALLPAESSYFIAAFSAMGETLQAILGAWLVRRFVGKVPSLTNEKEILYFLLLIGPVACLICATIGTTGYFISTEISYSDYWVNWLIWWITDSISALVVSPLMFILFSSNRKLWWNRKLTLAPASCSIFIILAFLFLWISKWETDRLGSQFKEVTNETYENLSASFTYYLDAVTAIERLFVSSPMVTRSQFKTFVEKSLAEKPGIHGLSWNPIVYDDQRLEFEKNIRKEGFPTFEITQRDDSGKLVEADKHDRYTVVNYIEPMASNMKAFGFNVGSNPDRVEAMNRAANTRNSVATAKITLVQETEKQSGFLLFYPVFNNEKLEDQDTENNLIGFVVGVFRVGEIVNRALSKSNKKYVITSIYDESVAEQRTHLFGPKNYESRFSQAILITNKLNIGGREWSVNFWTSEFFLNSYYPWQTLITLITSLIFSIVFSAIILTLTGRSYQLDKEVKERTAALHENRKNLMTTNETLEKTVADLERSNNELDQYAFVASHDLKSPLQSIFQLANWIEEDCSELLPKESRKHLDLLKDRIVRMETLLSDLLTFSRIGREKHQLDSINLQEMVKRAFEFNSSSDKFSLTVKECDVTLVLSRIPFELILRNLFSNAVKHHDKDSGTIIVEYDETSNEHIVKVSDDGPGIPENLQDKAYEMFHTLKSRDEVAGSGLGLSIVKKSVEQLEGSVTIKSDGVRGTCIELRWPKGISA